MHKAGFVSIVGYPNVGKSTLMNALIGEKLSITSYKAQTTRYKILGFFNDDESQIIFVDTPGFIKNPINKLHEKMNQQIINSINDCDVLVYMTEPSIKDHNAFERYVEKIKCPIFILVNKSDTSDEKTLTQYLQNLQACFSEAHILAISALYKHNTDKIIPAIKNVLPEHPPFFDKDLLSDRPIRFFTSEIIREQIFHLYKDEIPYCSEVIIESYKEKDDIDVIQATIFVEKESQKIIIIGKNGQAIKKLGTLARQEIEKFINKKVFLELNIKVRKNWRNDDNFLKKLNFF